MLFAIHRHLESNLKNSFNFRTGIDIGVISLIIILIFRTKIHTTGELTNYYEVGSAQKFLLQWRLVQQTIESSHRANICKEAQLLTHGQQTCFRANLSGWIVVELQRANSCKQHGISLHTNIVRSVGVRIAHLFDGMSATDGGMVNKLVAEFFCYSIKHSHTLFHNLRAYSVAL